jgi:hypothetical protein
MSDKIKVELVDREDYRIYNLVIERLAQVIPELGYAIKNCKDLEDHGFDMDYFKLQDAMVEIASVFAGTVAGLKYIKPSKESEVK